MNQKRYLIRGTLLLTLMGTLTRIAGFFYKVFLSRTIGASEIGVYQIAMPVFSFCTALCGGGVQTAISRFVAEYRAKGNRNGEKNAFAAGLFLSVTLSGICAAALYFSSDLIAKRFLLEESCGRLLRLMAFSLPFSMIHSCICGYFMGEKRVFPSAFSQFIEQMIRILTVLSVYAILTENSRQANAGIMALGQLAGEAASAIYCAGCMYYLNRQTASQKSLPHIQIRFLRQTLSVSLPLALNRMLMCILQAIEASLLPQMLQRSGYTSREALSIYGTFTGMALPLIFFPTAITSSLGMLLLPTVSEAHALRHQDRISYTTNATFLGGLLLGSFFLGMFLLFGEESGNLIFHSNLAGIYIRQLALICPLIYINTSMINILHGLDRSASILLWNMAGFALRLSGILLLVPEYGMTGYLSGLMADQLLLSICILFSLRRLKLFTVSIPDTLMKMLLPALSGGAIVFASSTFLPSKIPALMHLLLGGVIYSILFLLTALFFSVSKKQRARLFQRLHSALRQN